MQVDELTVTRLSPIVYKESVRELLIRHPPVPQPQAISGLQRKKHPKMQQVDEGQQAEHASPSEGLVHTRGAHTHAAAVGLLEGQVAQNHRAQPITVQFLVTPPIRTEVLALWESRWDSTSSN